MRNFIGYLSLIVVAFQILWADAPTPPQPPKPPIEIVIPPQPPVEQGRRTVAIVYETEDGTDNFARQIIRLRDEEKEFAPYLKEKGHTLYVLDDDTANAEGELSEFVKALLPLNSSLPCIYVLDSSDGRPLANRTVTFDVTAEEIMAFIKENGG